MLFVFRYGLENIFFLHFSLVSVQVSHNIAVVRTHWWLRSYSSQALERYKLKAECLSNLFWAAFCSELQFLVCLQIFNFESTKVARCVDGL